jgi:hypothetical protein
MRVQVNRTMYCEVDNISHLKLKDGKILVYLKEGYPKILKTRSTWGAFALRLVNAGIKGDKILEFKKGLV